MFQCEICDANFVQKGGLKKHITSVHDTKRSFNCDFCGNTLSRSEIAKVTDNVAKIALKVCTDCAIHMDTHKTNPTNFTYEVKVD